MIVTVAVIVACIHSCIAFCTACVASTGVASELSLTARVIKGEEARQVGLVTQVFADETALLQHAHKTAELIASKSPLAIVGTKRVLIHSRSVRKHLFKLYCSCRTGACCGIICTVRQAFWATITYQPLCKHIRRLQSLCQQHRYIGHVNSAGITLLLMVWSLWQHTTLQCSPPVTFKKFLRLL